jgi:hypothetical protein
VKVSELDANYRNLGDSVNQLPGTAFAYNFWLYIDSSTSGVFFSKTPKQQENKTYTPDYGLGDDQIILLMRGSTQTATYNNLCSGRQNPPPSSNSTTKKDVVSKCPLVKLENGGDVLTVEFNTMRSHDAVVANSRDTCTEVSTDWPTVNSYKIGLQGLKTNSNLSKQWFMVTVVVQGSYPNDPVTLRNKARCTIYVNGQPQVDKYVDGKLGGDTQAAIVRQNHGNLYVNPAVDSTYFYSSANTISEKSIMMADLTYFNYVPTPDKIKTMYNDGFTKNYAPPPGSSKGASDPGNAFMKNMSSGIDAQSLSQVGQSSI